MKLRGVEILTGSFSEWNSTSASLLAISVAILFAATEVALVFGLAVCS